MKCHCQVPSAALRYKTNDWVRINPRNNWEQARLSGSERLQPRLLPTKHKHVLRPHVKRDGEWENAAFCVVDAGKKNHIFLKEAEARLRAEIMLCFQHKSINSCASLDSSAEIGFVPPRFKKLAPVSTESGVWLFDKKGWFLSGFLESDSGF